MKRVLVSIAFALLVSVCGIYSAVAQPQTDREKFSYSIGFSVGQSLKQDGLDLDIQFLLKAISDVLTGETLQMTGEEMESAYDNYMKTQQAARQQESDENAKIGQAFLDQNGRQPGVVTLPEGLQYKIIREGQGAKPTLENIVTVHYRGTLLDGAEFDSSYTDGEPVKFQLKGLIKGWQVALPLMPQGSKWTLYIPSDLAYGMRGAPPLVKPGATLIFEIELIAVE